MFQRAHKQGVSPRERLQYDKLQQLLGKPTVDDLRAKQLEEKRQEGRRQYEENERRVQEAIRQRRLEGTKMTVSLYKSTASGAREIVVQTNAQSLDVFIASLADALHAALEAEPESAAQTISATLKNAFPVAFAIAGYKAEKVSESKLLTCGFASPDASELVAQSKV